MLRNGPPAVLWKPDPSQTESVYSLTCRPHFVQIRASLFKYVQSWHAPYVSKHVFCNLFAFCRSSFTPCTWLQLGHAKKGDREIKVCVASWRPILQSLQISRWLMHWLLCEGEASYLLPRCFRIRRRIIPGDSQPGVCSASQEGLWVVGFNIWF